MSFYVADLYRIYLFIVVVGCGWGQVLALWVVSRWLQQSSPASRHLLLPTVSQRQVWALLVPARRPTSASSHQRRSTFRGRSPSSTPSYSSPTFPSRSVIRRSDYVRIKLTPINHLLAFRLYDKEWLQFISQHLNKNFVFRNIQSGPTIHFLDNFRSVSERHWPMTARNKNLDILSWIFKN